MDAANCTMAGKGNEAYGGGGLVADKVGQKSKINGFFNDLEDAAEAHKMKRTRTAALRNISPF